MSKDLLHFKGSFTFLRPVFYCTYTLTTILHFKWLGMEELRLSTSFCIKINVNLFNDLVDTFLAKKDLKKCKLFFYQHRMFGVV